MVFRKFLDQAIYSFFFFLFNVADKVLVTNGDIIAEYVASPDEALDLNIDNALKNNLLPGFYNNNPNSSSANLESCNMPEICNVGKVEMKPTDNINMEYEEDINVKSADLFETNDQMIVEQNILSQTDRKDVLNYSFVDLDFDFANLHLCDVMQKEKCLVSKIINHLSTTLTSDCTMNETLQNYKRNKRESGNVTSNSDMSPSLKGKVRAFYEYGCRKTPRKFSSRLKHSRNRDILKPSTPTIKKQCSKFNTENTSNKKGKKTSDRVLLTPPCVLDNSIVSMSPNFNTPNHRKKINTKTPLILSRIHNDDIISRSPTFTTPVRTSGKRNIEKMSLVNGCLSSKVLKKSHEHKTQTQHSEFNRCKRYIAQSTPRRKKRSIYKLHSSRKRLDCYRQEDDVITDEFVARNSLKPINLDKTIFSEVSEDVTRHDILNSSFKLPSLNSNETLEMERQNCYNNYVTVKLDDGKYDADDTTHDNSDSSQMDLDNSFNRMEKQNESVDSSDNDKRGDVKYEDVRINSPFVTIRRNRFEFERATEPTNSTDNIGSTYTTATSLHGENDVDCVECDTKKFLNEDIRINISKTCNLHAKSWCSKKFYEPFPRKSEVENDSHTPTANLLATCGEQIYLSNSRRVYPSKIDGYKMDSKRAGDTHETRDSIVHKIGRSS